MVCEVILLPFAMVMERRDEAVCFNQLPLFCIFCIIIFVDDRSAATLKYSRILCMCM